MLYHRKMSGFTLIELTVVIVILGILAVTAFPRFINMRSEANIAAINGAKGAFQSAIQLAHSKSLIDGNENTATSTITMNGNTVAMEYGYPEAFNGLIAATNLGDVSGYGSELNNTEHDWVTQLHRVKSVNALGVTLGSVSGDGPNALGPEASKCYVFYVQASTTTEPKITVDTSGC